MLQIAHGLQKQVIIVNPKLLQVITEHIGQVLLTTEVPVAEVHQGRTELRLHQAQNRAVTGVVLLQEVAVAVTEVVVVRQCPEVLAQVVQEAQDHLLQAPLHQGAGDSK